MDLFELIKVVFRRWYVVVPVLLVTVGLAYYVQTNVPSEYEAKGWLIMQPPSLAGDPEASIDPVLLSQGIELEDDAAFTVSPAQGGQFGIAVSAPTSSAAEDGLETVIARLGEQITRFQEDNDVPEARRLELRTTSPGAVAEEQADGSYAANASMYLYTSTQITPNPYGMDAGTVSLLQVSVNGQSGQRRFVELAGPGVGFTLGLGDEGGLLSVMTYGSDEAKVVEGFRHVGTLANETLDQLQAEAGVDPSRRLTVGVADAPLAASDVSPPVNRATAGILALGGLLALGLALGLESLMRRRAATRSSGPDALADHPGPAAPAVEGAMADSAPSLSVTEGPEPEDVVAPQETREDVPIRVAGDADVSEPAAEPREARATAGNPRMTPGEHPIEASEVAALRQGHPDRGVELASGSEVVHLPVGRRATEVKGARSTHRASGRERVNGRPKPGQPARSARPARGSGRVTTEAVRFTGDGGQVSGHLALPPSGSGPGVVVIQEWWGLTDQIKQVAERLAGEGFVALAPDLYGDGVTTTDPERAGSLMQQLSVAQATTDLGAAVDFLLEHPAVSGESVGAIGFSMGGGFVLVLAAQERERIGAVVPYYGIGAYDQVDLSPMTAPVLGHFGSEDAFAPPSVAQGLEQALRRSGSTGVTIHVHEGAGHFFANEDNDFGTHDPTLSSSTFDETVTFLWDRLR